MFTLNKNGHNETTIPTQICINCRVDSGGFLDFFLINSEDPSTDKIPKKIKPNFSHSFIRALLSLK